MSHEVAQEANISKHHSIKGRESLNQTATSMKTVITSYSDVQQKTGVSSNLMGMFGFNLMNKLQKEIEGK